MKGPTMQQWGQRSLALWIGLIVLTACGQEDAVVVAGAGDTGGFGDAAVADVAAADASAVEIASADTIPADAAPADAPPEVLADAAEDAAFVDVAPPTCSPAQTAACDDGLTCTGQSCSMPYAICNYKLLDGWCLIGGACFASGSAKPDDACQVCAPHGQRQGLVGLGQRRSLR